MGSLGARVGAGVAGTVGLTLFAFGGMEMKKKHHLPLARARAAADVVESCRSGRCATLKGADGGGPTGGPTDGPRAWPRRRAR
jgi:hypothetical protein